ncbi:MAG: hypothetical protein IKU54_00100 [Oscillospiraceae bacterium]|nr:hypothetical protein [Oscillospiraceae bacterium]
MLKLQAYKVNELKKMFHKNRISNLERTLKTCGVEFKKSGSGENTTYTITAINDELRVFCVSELGFATQTEIRKLTNFLYYFLNVEDFVNLPDQAKEQYMKDSNRYVSRQTIAKYIRKLINANYVARSNDFIYYFVYKGVRKPTDKETYCKAWREYFKDKENGYDSSMAIFNMIANYGGYAQKYAPTEQNAIYAKEINHLNDLVLERIQVLYKENKTQTADRKDKDCRQSVFYFLLKHLTEYFL